MWKRFAWLIQLDPPTDVERFPGCYHEQFIEEGRNHCKWNCFECMLSCVDSHFDVVGKDVKLAKANTLLTSDGDRHDFPDDRE